MRFLEKLKVRFDSRLFIQHEASSAAARLVPKIVIILNRDEPPKPSKMQPFRYLGDNDCIIAVVYQACYDHGQQSD